MYVFDKNLLFIHIPRTGGTSIEEYLYKNHSTNFDKLYVKLGNIVRKKSLMIGKICLRHKILSSVIFPKCQWLKTHNILENEINKIPNNYTVFSVVRHPQTRVVSLYNSFARNTYTFSELLKFGWTGFMKEREEVGDKPLVRIRYCHYFQKKMITRFILKEDSFTKMVPEESKTPQRIQRVVEKLRRQSEKWVYGYDIINGEKSLEEYEDELNIVGTCLKCGDVTQLSKAGYCNKNATAQTCDEEGCKNVLSRSQQEHGYCRIHMSKWENGKYLRNISGCSNCRRLVTKWHRCCHVCKESNEDGEDICGCSQ